jgi:two-component system cell cycle sensor histidine kinase PleC
LAAVSIVYLTYAIVRSVWDGEKGATLALVGWLLIAAAVVHDILMDNQVIAGDSLLPFGCIAFFLCLSGVLTARSHEAFERAEHLSAELKRLNAGLEAVVGERTVELRHKILELEVKQTALELSREAAVAANETKSRFLANMSHELRTPLNAILGFSEIIHKRILGDDIDRYGGYAKDIHFSGRHLLSLINDILDLSTVEAGKLELHGVRLDLNAQIEAALRLVEARAAAKSIRLAFEPAEPLDVVADERALQQVLINLLTNAVKFTHAGGAVSARVYRKPEGSIVVAIEDTGTGIKPEDMLHVLESFGRGRHDIAAADERGTGLGLPIVKALVEAHGGTFALESKFGVGTKAIVSFPADRTVAFGKRALVGGTRS